MALERLTKRPQFQRITRDGLKFVSQSFIIQVLPYEDQGRGRFFGVTASRRVGNAVKRNRAKRRMRPLLQGLADKIVCPAYDMVMVARQDIIQQTSHQLLEAVEMVSKQINKRLKKG